MWIKRKNERGLSGRQGHKIIWKNLNRNISNYNNLRRNLHGHKTNVSVQTTSELSC